MHDPRASAPTVPFHVRQGDVLLVAVEAVPDDAVEQPRQGRLVLAEGEATGHAHAIAERDAREFRVGTERFVLVRSAARLHPRGARPDRARARAPTGSSSSASTSRRRSVCRRGVGWSTDAGQGSAGRRAGRARPRPPRPVDGAPALDRARRPPRAEAALRDLYAERGLAAPVVRWVARRPRVRSSGPTLGAPTRRSGTCTRAVTRAPAANHDFNNLADPFGLDPRWLNRMAQRVVERLPEGIRAPQPVRRNAFGGWVTPDPRTLEVLAGRLPTDDLQVLGQIRWAVEQMLRGEAVLGIDLSASARVVHRRPEVPRDRGLAIRLLGGAWDDLEATVGADLLEAIVFDGFADSVEWLLDPSALSRDAIQAMNPRPVRPTSPVGGHAPRAVRRAGLATAEGAQGARTAAGPTTRAAQGRRSMVCPRGASDRLGATAPAVARRSKSAPCRGWSSHRLWRRLRHLGLARHDRPVLGHPGA